jgi:hypothetical protein
VSRIVASALLLVASPALSLEPLDVRGAVPPRLGVLVGAESGLDQGAHGLPLCLRAEAETAPLPGYRFHALTGLASLSYSSIPTWHDDHRARMSEVRLVPGVRWTAWPDRTEPRFAVFLDGGVGAFWSSHTPSTASIADRWDRPQAGVIGRLGAGAALDVSSRSRWMIELAVEPYLTTDRSPRLTAVVGYAFGLR